MMRRYTPDEEQRIRLQARVREWARAGLLDVSQAERLERELRTDLKRTNGWLRAAIALFTGVIVSASVALVFVASGIRGDSASTITFALAGVVCFGLADYLVGAVRLYRYGVEEALAMFGVILLSISALAFVNSEYRGTGHAHTIAALMVGAVGSFGAYRRFGFIYAGIAAMICTALLPFQFNLTGSTERICAAAVFGAIFVVARALYRREGDDFPGDEHATLEAAACAGAYLSLNLRAFDLVTWWLWNPAAPAAGRLFYWATYVATWLIPAAALFDAIRAKDRLFLIVGTAMALVTLATNKPYLGWPRQTWDPMLLGVLLIGSAVALRRWLAAGRDGCRNGYTASRILRTDQDVLAGVANVSVTWNARVHQPPPPGDAASPFKGGRSGGAGGGANY